MSRYPFRVGGDCGRDVRPLKRRYATRICFFCRPWDESHGYLQLSLRDRRRRELFATSRKIGWSAVPSGLVRLSSHDPGVETPGYCRGVPSGLVAGGWVQTLEVCRGTVLGFREI